MKRILIIALTLMAPTLYVDAQTSEDSVKAVINQLFGGMKNSDPVAILSAFSDSAILQTIAPNKNDIQVRNENIGEFAKSIGGLKKGAADERITFASIKIDGPLAMVWAPYKFYFNGTFSHCGVDSFQLVYINGKWQIQYLIDTRRRQPCEQ